MSVCLFVCLCLSVRSHISKTTSPSFTKYSVQLRVARSFSDDNYIMYFRSCFHTMGPVGQNQARRYLRRLRQVAAPGAKSDVYNCLVATLFKTVSGGELHALRANEVKSVE